MYRRVSGTRTGPQTHQPRINAVFLQNAGDECLALLSPGVHNPGLLSQAGQYLDLWPPGSICRGPAGQAHAGRNDKLSKQVPHITEDASTALFLAYRGIVYCIRGLKTWKGRITS
jgi:hypothetical protein